MNHSEETRSGSLELLLDTICNTFGGILFISILVVVLLNMVKRQIAIEAPKPSAQLEMLSLKRRLSTLQQELATLRTMARQQEDLRDMIVSPELEALAEQLKVSEETSRELVSRANRVLLDTCESQAEVNRIATALKGTADGLRKAKEELARVETELRGEIQARTRTAKLPVPRDTFKDEVALFLKEGRLTCYAKVGPGGGLTPNTQECEEKADRKGRYAEPRDGAGTPVDLGGGAAERLSAQLAHYDPDRCYLAVAVWPDSFAHFGVVRNLMVQLHFEYRLIPMEKDARIYFGPITGDVKVF